jgi:hypothetical protein
MFVPRLATAALFAILVGGACAADDDNSSARFDSASTATATTESVPAEVTTTTLDLVSTEAAAKPHAGPSLSLATAVQDLEELFVVAPGLEVVVRREDGAMVAVTHGADGTATHDSPSLRLPLGLIADPAFERGEVQGARLSSVLGALDVFWTGHGYHSVVPAGSNADLVAGFRPVGLDVANGGIVVSVGSDVDPNHARTLRHVGVGADWGLEESEGWTVEFDEPILFFDALSSGQIIVGTSAPGEPLSDVAANAHVLSGGGDILATLELPAGVVWIQDRVQATTQTMVRCSSGASFVDGDVTWVVGDHQLLTACVEDRMVGTTRWCCGMGEIFFAFDSNGDGRDEVVVGGTSVGGGGGGVYSLVDRVLGAVRFGDGKELAIEFGTVGDSYNGIGCAGGELVNVRATSEGNLAFAELTRVRIDGLVAVVESVETIEWAHGLPGEPRPDEVWNSSPSDLLADLEPC